MEINLSLPELCENILKLSKVKEKEKVIILTMKDCEAKYLDAWTTALINLKANFFTLTLSAPIRAEVRPRASKFVYDTLKSADMVLILHHHPYTPPTESAFMLLYGVNEGNDLLFSGTRVLACMIPEVQMRSLFPTQDLVKRTYAGAKLIDEAETIRITSEAGTNLTMSKEGRKGHCEVGIADEPGRWDNYGFGSVGCAPLEDSANGTLVINTNDYFLGRYVTQPIKCTLRNGRIIKIEGGEWARFLEMWLAQWNDPESSVISHVGWGTHKKARWFTSVGPVGLALETFYGSVCIAFGYNVIDSPAKYSGLGGKNRAVSHLDIGLLNCDFYLDEETIVKSGKIVHPRCK